VIPDGRKLYVERMERAQGGPMSPPWYVVLGAEDLKTASDEAGQEAAKGRGRPYMARRAPASIALLLMAFESWIKRTLTLMHTYVDQEPPSKREKLLELITRGSLADKALRVPEYGGGHALHRNQHSDLLQLIAVRYELMHDLPATNKSGEPAPLDFLNDRGLLLSSENPQAELMLAQRLESYDLAWWAWEVINNFIEAIRSASQADYMETALLQHNFDLPQQWQIRSPADVEAGAKNR
jgi:hypothetical protein